VRDPEAQTLQSLTPLQFPTHATQQALSDAERRAQFDAFVREGERDIAEAEAEMIEDTIADTVEDTIADTEEEEESDDIKMEEEE
jgi:chromosome condensin MukBEF MukE localization factor